mmetsp:Transcript_10886/g.30062  ORF Transcript_10886/g.30062 Transcript_10886/m.30062 type:complete len:89 (-) Transcript_10886:1667-1933(-)
MSQANEHADAAIIIPDEERSLDASNRLFPKEYDGHLKSLMIPREEILSRIQTLAKTLSKDYEGKRPVMLCVLKGACPVSQESCDNVLR